MALAHNDTMSKRIGEFCWLSLEARYAAAGHYYSKGQQHESILLLEKRSAVPACATCDVKLSIPCLLPLLPVYSCI